MSSAIDKCKGCKELRKKEWKRWKKRIVRRRFKNVKLDYDRHYDRVYYNRYTFC